MAYVVATQVSLKLYGGLVYPYTHTRAHTRTHTLKGIDMV